MNNHCMVLDKLTICHFPDTRCFFFKNGYTDCFYNIMGKCCNMVAITSAINKEEAYGFSNVGGYGTTINS